MSQRRCPRRAHTLAAAVALAAAAGCAAPFDRETSDALRRSILESAQREIAPGEPYAEPRPTERSSTSLNIPADRLEELDAMAGPKSYVGVAPALDENLFGEETTEVAITLRDAISRGVRYNLRVQAARVTPAITEAQVVAAEAAFDWVLFASANASRIDQPSAVPVINNLPVGSAVNKRQNYAFETGVRKPLTTGGTLQITTGFGVSNNQNPNIQLFPDPARAASLDILFAQPLLRNFGSETAEAQIYLAQNLERDAIQTLRLELIDTVAQVERAYWDLLEARAFLLIRQRLLERGIETRDVLEGRLDFDVKPAEYSDAVARVETRRADVIRGRNDVRQRSDALKTLINDPNLPVGGEIVLAPIDRPLDAPVEYSLADAISEAIASRPDVQRAVLRIDDASIRERVAINQKLPVLDLTAQATFNGLGDSPGDAYEQIGDASFVNMILGLIFEWPIGNRGPEAEARRRQLERLQSVIDYRAVVQNATLEVVIALRNIVTNYRLIEQTRIARIASAENLRTLQVEEENIRALTPDFLDLKLRRQESLALSEAEEVRALRDYNVALSELTRAVGTALERNRIEFVVPNPGDLTPP